MPLRARILSRTLLARTLLARTLLARTLLARSLALPLGLALVGSPARAADLPAMMAALPDCRAQLATLHALSDGASGEEAIRIGVAIEVLERLDESRRFRGEACGRCAQAAVSEDPALRAAAASAARQGTACPSLTARPEQAEAVARYRAESLHLVDAILVVPAQSITTVVPVGGVLVPLRVPTAPSSEHPTWEVVSGDGERQRTLAVAAAVDDPEALRTLRSRRARAIGLGVGGTLLGVGAFAWSLDSLVNGDGAGGAVLLLASSGLLTVGIAGPASAVGRNRSFPANWEREALDGRLDAHNAALREDLGLAPADVADVDELEALWDPRR